MIFFSRFRQRIMIRSVLCLLSMTLMSAPTPGQGIVHTLEFLPFGMPHRLQVQGSTALGGAGPAGPRNESWARHAGEQGAEPKGGEKKGQAEEREFSTFWIIGILINLIVFALFVVWGVREWRKTKHRGPL